MREPGPVGLITAERRSEPIEAARLFECCYGRAPDLAAIEVPTVVLHGAADLVVPIDAGRALALAIPGAKFLELPGAGHAPTVTRPAEVAAAVRATAGRRPRSTQTSSAPSWTGGGESGTILAGTYEPGGPL